MPTGSADMKPVSAYGAPATEAGLIRDASLTHHHYLTYGKWFKYNCAKQTKIWFYEMPDAKIVADFMYEYAQYLAANH